MKLFLVVGLTAAAFLGGCGASEETISETTNPSQSDPTPQARAPIANWEALERAAGPKVDQLILPTGSPPQKIVIKDLRVGKGRGLRPKHQFKVRYLALEYATGEVRQNVWKPPFFALWRGGELVDSFEVGLEGMRVGGVRELIAPSSLTYKDGALVYLIKLIKVGKKGW